MSFILIQNICYQRERCQRKAQIFETSFMNASLAVPWRWRDVSLRCLRWLLGETRRTFGFPGWHDVTIGFPGWDDVTLGSRRRLPCLLPILTVFSQKLKLVTIFQWILLFPDSSFRLLIHILFTKWVASWNNGKSLENDVKNTFHFGTLLLQWLYYIYIWCFVKNNSPQELQHISKLCYIT